MKRYGLFPVIGDGTVGHEYRPSVADLANTNSSAVIDDGPSHAFTIVAANPIGPVLLLTNSYLFPHSSIDHLMNTIGADIEDTGDPLFAMIQACGARGVDTDFWTDDVKPWDQWIYRDVLQGIGEQFEPAFQIDHFDTSEVV